MSAAEALNAAYAAGVRVGIEGDDLIVEASAPPPTDVVDLLLLNKGGIVALLRPSRDGWSAEDWQGFFDERAGIAEHDGDLTRAEAEKEAFEATVVEWRNRRLRPSAPYRCASCGKAVAADAIVLPMPAPTWGQLWVHAACWPAWTAARQAEAIAALAALGIRGTMEGADHGDQ